MGALLFVVGESAEPSMIDAEGDMDLNNHDMGGSYDDSQGLGESEEPRETADTEGKEPGDGSDPPKGGADEEVRDDDSEAPKDHHMPDMSTLLGKIATGNAPGPLVPTQKGEFVKIPHFEYQGTPENVKNQEECQKKCTEQEECRSYSWNEGDQKCSWSTGSLRYGHMWSFFSKEFDLNAFGRMEPTKEYFRFKGLFAIDEDQNMKTIEEKNIEECKEICNEDPKCLSFSFHEGDNACLMGVSKVDYKKGWNYFERNRPPRDVGGEWRPYPPRLDSYHAALREREKKSLGILAEKDKKIRVRKEAKEAKVKQVSKATERRTKRLDAEMKQKQFAAEQGRKKKVMAAKRKKIDLAAAVERGKFDEAFHKQAEINKELLHKKTMESAVKDSMVHRIHERDQKDTKKVMKKISDMRERSKKELDEKKKETESKERLVKNNRRARAVGMKKEAFGLIAEERKYKSFSGFTETKKKDAKFHEKLLHKKWVAEDKETKYVAQEKEVKRQISLEKQTHEVNRKLIKEKEEKGTPPGGAPTIPADPPPPLAPPPAYQAQSPNAANAPGRL
jgi:hypothetical protein